MKKKLVLIVVVIALVALILVGCTEKETVTVEPDVELLVNNQFEAAERDSGWTWKDYGESGKVTFANENSAATGHDDAHGQSYVRIIAESNSTTNTRIWQTVKVQPNCVYKFSAEYRIPSEIVVAEGGKGAYISLDGFQSFNDHATEATNGWKTLEVYFNSDEYEEVTVVLGLGEEDYTVSGGTVYFDNVSMMRLSDEEAATVSAPDLTESTTVTLAYDYAYRIGKMDILFTVLIVVLSAALLVVAYFVLRRLSVKKETEIAENGMVKGAGILKNTSFLLCVTLAVGFAIRLVMTLVLVGYSAYESTVMSHVASMVENGLKDFYFSYSNTYYAPFTTYLLYIMGLIAVPLKLSPATQGMAIFLKIPALIADLLIVAFAFLAVDKRKGSVWAFVTGLVLALLPILYMASSLWGVYTSIAVLFLTLTFMAVRERKVIKMTVFYFFAVMFAEAALILLPLLVVYAVVLYIKYPETRIKLPVSATVALMVGYAVTVPLALNYYVAGHPFIVLEHYVTVFNQNTYFARNVFNLYAMCGVGNDVVDKAGIAMGAIFAAAAMLGGIGMYLKNHNRQDLTLYAAWTLIAVYTLCVRMNIWVLMIGIVLLFMYVLYTDEKRLMWVLGAYSVLTSINLCYLMAVGGNVIKGGGFSATMGVAISSNDPVAILFSVFALLTFFGLTYVAADICLGRKKPIMPLTRSVKDWCKEKFASKKKAIEE